MIDPDKLAAFMLVTATTSLIPGQSMLFVMGQSIWRGAQAGWAALLGMQLGYVVWWVLAGLGLGTLAKAYPLAFRGLAILGITYLAWMGVQAIRHSFHASDGAPEPQKADSGNAFRDGIVVAIGNPKSLVYMVALIPPFVDATQPIGWQIVTLAVVALVIDLIVGAAYITAGRRLARVIERPSTRQWLDRGMGLAFLVIAALIMLDLLSQPV
ncbi:MAG: LysE family translocator [Erythrobacter sp.]